MHDAYTLKLKRHTKNSPSTFFSNPNNYISKSATALIRFPTRMNQKGIPTQTPIYVVCGVTNHFPVEKGGALFNSGPLRIKNTVFAENTAEDGGLAIQNVESAVELRNVTFDENKLSCPSQMYGDIDDVSTVIIPPTFILTSLEYVRPENGT